MIGVRAGGFIGSMLAIVVAIAVVVLAAQSAQTPARDARIQPTPAPSGTASLSGTVVSSLDTTRRIRLAPVVLVGTTTGVLRVTATDASGRFSFTGLPADGYLVGASKPPYLGAVAGAKRPARPGTAIALADGQKIGDVLVQLPPGAAISGTVLDERGRPAPNVPVNLFMAQMQSGERVLVPGPGAGLTDERGRYRIFGLAPGEYVLAASPRGLISGWRTLTDAEVDAALKSAQAAPESGLGSTPGATPAPSPGPSPPAVGYAPVFFPGTTRAIDAGPVTIGVGEDRTGIDIRIELVHTAKVEGTVLGLDQLPPGSRVSIRATPPAAAGPGAPTAFGVGAPDGKFTLTNLAPGSYTLLTTANVGPAVFFATAQVDVAGVDQSGVQLTLQPALSLPARIAFAGTAAAPPLAGYRIPVRLLPPTAGSLPGPLVNPTNATGAFAITNMLPGQYLIGGPLFLGASQASLTWSLESVVADGKDVTDLPIEIGSGTLPRDIVITYGDRSQELTGRIQLASGSPATDYTIVVFPADKNYWIPGSRRIVTTRTDSDGRYRLGGPGLITLPAGAYLLAAVSEIDRDQQFDPAFLESLRPTAVPATIQPGETKTQNLTLK